MIKSAFFAIIAVSCCSCAKTTVPGSTPPPTAPITADQAWGLDKGPGPRHEDATTLPAWTCGVPVITPDKIGGPHFAGIAEKMGSRQAILLCDGFTEMPDDRFRPNARVRIDDEDEALYIFKDRVLACPILNDHPGSCASKRIDPESCCNLIGVVQKQR